MNSIASFDLNADLWASFKLSMLCFFVCMLFEMSFPLYNLFYSLVLNEAKLQMASAELRFFAFHVKQ